MFHHLLSGSLRGRVCYGVAFASIIIFPVMLFSPMPLGRLAEPFNHPDWIFEIKWDGFRCLAYLENGRCKLVSRKGNQFKSFPALNIALPEECKADGAVLDGEIVCLDDNGVSQFSDLLLHRGEPRFYAFDLLSLNGKDQRYVPLAERKHGLRAIIPHAGERRLYCDHVEAAGQELFNLVCARDLEGIVAKRKYDPYLLDGSAGWLKIRNRKYSQWAGREELFERERSTDPEWENWNHCALLCEQWHEADAQTL
jgi:bifunctional non-homologous end joining protein LigD